MTDVPPPLADHELDELLMTACSQRLGFEAGPPPIALQAGRRAAMKTALKNMKDSDGQSVRVAEVHASFDPDDRGLIEVLFLDGDPKPMTAWVKGRELAYMTEGW